MAVYSKVNKRLITLRDKIFIKVNEIEKDLTNITTNLSNKINIFKTDVDYLFNKLLNSGTDDSINWAGKKSKSLLYTKKGRKRVGITPQKEHLCYYVANTRGKILCGGNAEDKTEQTYRYVSEALEHTYFIQVKPKRNDSIIGSLNIVVDIDDMETFKNFSDINDFCLKNRQPLPTFITKTNKGWHLLYTLDNIYKPTESLSYELYKEVSKYVNTLFNGDVNAAGFIMRNPLNHHSEFNNSVYSLIDFVPDNFIIDLVLSKFYTIIESYDLNKIRLNNKKSKVNNIEVITTLSGVKELIDLSKVEIGYRNSALVGNLRTLGFRALKDKITKDEFIEIALLENSKFTSPLPTNEVIKTAISTYSFCVRNFDDSLAYSDAKLFRQLADLVKSRKMKQMIEDIAILITADYIELKDVIEPTWFKNKLAKLINVDIKTLNKYLVDIQEFFIIASSIVRTEVSLTDLTLNNISVLDLLSYFKEANFDNIIEYNKFISEQRQAILAGEYDLSFIKTIPNSDLLHIKHMEDRFWSKNRRYYNAA